MSQRDDPLAPKPEDTPDEEPKAGEVEAEGSTSERGEAVEVGAEPVEEEERETVDVSEETKRESDSSETWALLAHLGPLILLLIGISMPLVFLVPLTLLHTVAVGNSTLEHHAKEAMNFHLNVAVLSLALTATCVLIPLLVPLWLGALVLGLIATFKTAEGELYSYPWIYRVVE